MEFTINDNKYSSSPLNVREQFHIVRKLGAAIPIMGILADPKNAEKDPTLLITTVMARLDDESSDFVMSKCLSVVSRQHMGSWAKIQTPEGSLMFTDITLAAMLTIASKVLVENVGTFFHTALTDLGQAAEKK